MEIPKEVLSILEKLKKSGFEAYIVGGCVRDYLRGEKPSDWDITTNAKPEEILKIFKKSYYDNKFFTVTVLTQSEDPTLREVEITTFRKEGKYSDKRHPDKVEFAKTLKEDLSRRDFTINAMAIDVFDGKIKIVDPFWGREDLRKKIIRAVGDPKERFLEDPLRMLRAVRFLVTLGEGWQIEEKTASAIKENSSLITYISFERIRDEFLKIINCQRAKDGIEFLREFGLLKYFLIELEECYGVSQNKHHIFDCWEHSLRSLDFAAKNNFPECVRLAALFHDIGKPRTKRGEGPDATFYGHEVVGAKMTEKIMRRLKFKKEMIDKVVTLVRWHLFYYNPGEVKESAVRRLIKKVGLENMEYLIQLRMADRVGSGVKKAEPYKLRHLKYMIEKVSRDPISPKMLKIKGDDVMRVLEIGPSPKVGQVLIILLKEVMEDPKKNERDYLIEELKKMKEMKEEDFLKKAFEAKKWLEEIEQKRDEMTKKKYWVF
jgi:poly(A) polymerase/tRNA nucleotidyltransferase (CCA-adding enzyme)